MLEANQKKIKGDLGTDSPLPTVSSAKSSIAATFCRCSEPQNCDEERKWGQSAEVRSRRTRGAKFLT